MRLSYLFETIAANDAKVEPAVLLQSWMERGDMGRVEPPSAACWVGQSLVERQAWMERHGVMALLAAFGLDTLDHSSL
jgi:hypothetical protein